MARKAEQLAAQASTWVRGRSKVDGTGFFVIPSSDGKSGHYANAFGCTCRSFVNRGECSHHVACQILQRQADAQIAAKHVKRSYESLFGADDDPYCADCHRHHQRGQHYTVAV